MNPHLRILESVDGHRIEHVPSGERIATFKTADSAARFVVDIERLDWSFSDPLRTPMATWAGLLTALEKRGVKVEPNWKLRDRGIVLKEPQDV